MSAEELQKIISPKFTEQVLNDMIQKKTGFSEIKVSKIEIGAASKKGDSYLSTVYRFTVSAIGKNKENQEESVFIPVIVKFLPKNIGRTKTFRSAEFFENEAIFYEHVWTSFQKFQEKANIANKFNNIPFVLSAHIDGTNDYIAMVDLSVEGYRSAERGAGLDYEHTCAILRVLAGFHALSLAFKDNNFEEFEKAANSLKETYFSERLRPWYERFQENVFEVVRDSVSQELSSNYLDRLNKIIDNDLLGVLIKTCQVRGPLSVVTHGDVWVPNFLIKYEGSKPGNITMIDFQLSRYTTLATDLSFFLYCCADISLLESKYEDLVAEYHQGLCQALESYGAKKDLVSLKDIHRELQDYSVMGVGMSMEALIMAQLEDDEVSDLDAIKSDEAVPLESVWIIKPFKEQAKRRRIASMIKFAVDRNFI